MSLTEALRSRLGERRPSLALVLGSGLGDLVDAVEDADSVPYEVLHGFPAAASAAMRGGSSWAGWVGAR